MSSELPQETARHIFIKTSPETSTNNSDKGFLSLRHLKWAIGFLLSYFGIRLVYLAFNVSSFVPPDEVTHAGLCKIFASVFLLPDNSPQTYEFGLVTNIPWLYYWTMGKLLHLNIFGLTDLVFLRLLNIPLAFGTVWYILRLLRLLTEDRLTQLLLVIVMTNTAMFSLLSASVSYDNLTNLLAAMAIYYLFAFFKERSGGFLVASIICQLAGCLTKITFLPLVLGLGLLLFIYESRYLGRLPASVAHHLRTSNFRGWISILAILVTLGLNFNLYGRNYLNYGVLYPSMQQVLSPETAMQYRLAARGMIFNQYREGKISYMDALLLAGEIKHPGDKSDTFYLLMNYEKLKRNPQLWLGPLQYVKVWFETVLATIFGIKAHMPMYKDPQYLTPIYLVLALSLFGFIARWRPRESGWLPASLATIACYYAGYLLYMVNYDNYLNYGVPGITLQGRYLFPIIGPVYVLLCHYLLQLFRSDKIRLALALTTALLFIAYDFPWFLMHATPQWYEWMPR